MRHQSATPLIFLWVGLTHLLALVVADVAPFQNSSEFLLGNFGTYTRQKYLSNPDLSGPVGNVLTPPSRDVSPSKYILWAPIGPTYRYEPPLMLDAASLSTVWIGPVHGPATVGPTVQRCGDTEYITWWTGDHYDNYKHGRWYMYDKNYKLAYNITAIGNFSDSSDAHEMFVTPQCTAIISVYKELPYDLSPYGITDGWLLDSYFQEIDLATGELLFEWQASKHVDIQEADDWFPDSKGEGRAWNHAWDYFHINSVEKDEMGNYLISARHTCAVYYISGITGEVIWRLGGLRNGFQDLSGGLATNFRYQHMARWVNAERTRLSIYDDRNNRYNRAEDPVSRGIILELDYERKTVTLQHTYMGTNQVASVREGSMQVLDDGPRPGNVLLGYGNDPGWTEYLQDGTVIWDVAFGPMSLDRASADNYRALKVNFTGSPLWLPRIAPGPESKYVFNANTSIYSIQLEDDAGNSLPNNTVYFSWNGATEIRSWVVLASNETADMSMDNFWAEVPHVGFENSCFVGTGTRHVAVFPIDNHDQVLSRTGILDLVTGEVTSKPARAQNGTVDTAELSRAWQKFRASQSRKSLLGKVKTQLDSTRQQVVESHPTAAGLGAVGGILLIALTTLLCSRSRCSKRRSRFRTLGYLGRSRSQYPELLTEEAMGRNASIGDEDFDSGCSTAFDDDKPYSDSIDGKNKK